MSTMTRILLNPATRGGRKLLTQPQAMHAAVRACFPPDIDEDDTRVLWRVDQVDHMHSLLLVGPERPDPTPIVEQAGWATRPGETADYDRLLSQLVTGQDWAFRLVANPVRSLPTEQGRRGKVVPHVTPSQQLSWLVDKSTGHGFTLLEAEDGSPSAVVTGREDLRFAKGSGARHLVTLRTARFEGQLRITDVDLMRETLRKGIGRARAYGCGMLTIARPAV